jgi:integrase/recombinase XerD
MKGEGEKAPDPMPRESREPILLTADRAIAAPPALVRAGLETLPAAIAAAGARTSERFIDFFTANIRNRNTRMAYAVAVRQFFNWCEQRGLRLEAIRPTTVAAYIEQLGTDMAKPSVKQHLAAIRQLFDYLVTGGILLSNPAGAVRGPKYVVKRGKTPVLSADQARQLLDSIDVAELSGLRDRALIGVMVYTFARVSAVTTMRVEDYFEHGKRAWLRLHEKGGKRHEVPCHHNLTEYLDAWIQTAKIEGDKKGPLFRAIRKGSKLTENPMAREDVLAMIKRRAAGAALPYSTCCHTFRATGITTYLQNGGTLEHAQQIAAHESPRTTKLYDRTQDEISLDEVERIRI